MKRLIIVVCVAGLLAALPMSHLVAAGKGPAPKVDICHVTDSVDGLGAGGNVTLIVGHVINVSENAVDAHLAHGDSTVINDIDDGPVIFGLTWRQVAENLGLNTAGANCAAFLVN